MTEALVVLDGSTFFVSAPSGDVEPSTDASGYFVADVRHLSTWQLLADGEPLRRLSSGTVDYYSANIHATLAGAPVGKNPTVTVRRDSFVSDGVHEDLTVTNNSPSLPAWAWSCAWELTSRTSSRSKPAAETPDDQRGLAPTGVRLSYERDGFRVAR